MPSFPTLPQDVGPYQCAKAEKKQCSAVVWGAVVAGVLNISEEIKGENHLGELSLQDRPSI